jgi:hypothetical protein
MQDREGCGVHAMFPLERDESGLNLWGIPKGSVL